MTIQTDILIIGGGIAGMWTLNRLTNLGYSAILLEKSALGDGQSMKSQGIIHGGVKYSLTGEASQAAQAIASMPKRWSDSLNGCGEIDLSQAEVLSPYHYMWSKGSLSSKLTTFFASKAVSEKMHPIAKEDEPIAFKDAKLKSKLYALHENVLDIPSVFQTLAQQHHGQCFQIDGVEQLDFQLRDDQSIESVKIKNTDLSITPKFTVFTAGEGNEALMEKLKLPTKEKPEMQRRAVHMCLVKHHYDFPIYAHCIGTGSKPELTITSHRHSDGSWVYYLGGNLSEDGVDLSQDEQIEVAKDTLKKLVPWLDFSTAQFDTFKLNKAEPKTKGLLRPDSSFVQSLSNCCVAWPTKLALAPQLADEVILEIQKHDIKASNKLNKENVIKQFQSVNIPTAKAAIAIWEQVFK